MCIRDRYGTIIRVFRVHYYFPSSKVTTVKQSYCYDGLTAVSYTHLDVYKRQMYILIVRKFCLTLYLSAPFIIRITVDTYHLIATFQFLFSLSKS